MALKKEQRLWTLTKTGSKEFRSETLLATMYFRSWVAIRRPARQQKHVSTVYSSAFSARPGAWVDLQYTDREQKENKQRQLDPSARVARRVELEVVVDESTKNSTGAPTDRTLAPGSARVYVVYSTCPCQCGVSSVLRSTLCFNAFTIGL